jgi:hypothetical protein
VAGAEVGEERHGWLAELDGGEGTSGRCGGTKSFCVDPHWGEPEVNEVAVVVAVEPDEGVEETTVVVVTIAVGELGDVGAAGADTVRRADVLECRAVGCASDGGTERGHNADVAWRRGARVGGCCVEGGNEELV